MRIILCLILLIQSIPAWSRVDTSLNARITHFEELQRKVQTNCLNNAASSEFKITIGTQTLNCRDLIAVVKRLKAQLERDVAALEASCEEPPVPTQANALAQDSLRIARAAGLCPIRSRDSQCMGQVACAAIAVANPLAGLLAQVSTLSGVKNTCANTGAACMQNIFKGIIDSLWSTISSIWDLAKAGVVRLGQALGLVRRSEAATSERGLAAQQTAPSFISQFKRNPGATLRTLASNIFQGLKQAAMNSYGCEKWSGAPFVSRCVTPMTNWDCASCQQKITVFCGIGGIAVGEIVTAFFTGGLAAGAKFIATGALRAVKGIQQGRRVSQASATAMRSAQAVLRAIPKSAEGLAVASRTALRVTQGAARVATAAERRAMDAWDAIKASRTSRALATAATAAGNSSLYAGIRIALKPVSAYLDAIDDAARLGFSSLDDALATTVTRTDRVVDVAEVITDGTSLVNAADNTIVTTGRTENALAAPVIPPRANTPTSGLIVSSNRSNVVSNPATFRASPFAPTSNVNARVSTIRRNVTPSPLQGQVTRPRTEQELLDITTAQKTEFDGLLIAGRSDANIPDLITDINRSGLDDFFRRNPNYNDQQRARITELYGDLNRNRAQLTREVTQRNLDEIRPITKQEPVDCGKLNHVFPGSFRAEAGCSKVEFTQTSQGQFCTCNTKKHISSRGIGPWFAPCAGSMAHYDDALTYGDVNALPVKDELTEGCWKVDIKPGTVCYQGGLDTAFQGFGAGAQILCQGSWMDRVGADGLSKRQSAAEVGLDFPASNNAVGFEAAAYAPLASDARLLSITNRGRICRDNATRVCSPEELAELRREFEATANAMGPSLTQRERNNFNEYFEYLEGKTALDSRTGNLIPGSNVTNLNLPTNVNLNPTIRIPSPELRRVGALSDPDRLREASTVINRPLTSVQQTAVIEAHEIGAGTGRGFFTYTADEINQKALKLRAAGFSAPEIRLLMERGVTGSVASGKTAGDLFAEARSALTRANDEKTKYARAMERGNADEIESVVTNYSNYQRQGAEGYLAEGLRTNSPQLFGESWRSFARSGDGASALRTVQSALRQFPTMKSDSILVDFRNRIAKINQELISNPGNKILLQEKAALVKIVDGIRPPVVAPVRTVTPVTPVGAPVAPVVPSGPVFKAPPANARASEVRNVANDYRLGSGGKPKDAEVASQYYYHIAREAMNKEALALKSSNRSSRYFDDNDTSNAFAESISGNGTVARQMLADLKAKRGSSGVNEIILEIHERGMYMNKDPAVKKKFTEFINFVDETYKKENVLFRPQENIISNWRSYNFVED
jgi:hypothetical protein